MHNHPFAPPGTQGMQAHRPANLSQTTVPSTVVPITLPPPQYPVVHAQLPASNLLHPFATAAQAQQPARVTAAPLQGAGAKRSAPDSVFNQPVDSNKVRRVAAQLVPRVDANAVGIGDPGMLPAPEERADPRLIQAIIKGDLRTLRRLLAAPGINVNAGDESGLTALHNAVLVAGMHDANNIEDLAAVEAVAAVALLLAVPDIDVNVKDKDGRTALHHAACFPCRAFVVGPLLNAPGIDLHARDTKGYTAFDEALKNGSNAIVQALFGSELKAEDLPANAHLALAAAQGDQALVKALLADPNVDVNAKSFGGNTALMLAAANGHDAVVRRLLAEQGIDVNDKDDNNNTALYLAAENGHEGVLRSLLAAPDLHINANSLENGTALRAAARNGKQKTFLALLAAPGVETHVGGTPALMDAACNSKQKNLNAMLAMPGIDVNAAAVSRWTGQSMLPLVQAARLGHEANIRLLLAMPNIDINAKDDSCDNALLTAVREGHEAVVRALLAMPNIRLDVKDSEGNTALSIAEKNRHDTMAKALRNHARTKLARPDSVLMFIQRTLLQPASSATHISSPEAARELDKLCERLQLGQCTAADAPAMLALISSLPAKTRSFVAASLAFGVVMGHYANADGVLDNAVVLFIDKAELRGAYEDACKKLRVVSQQINLLHVNGMNLLGAAAKAGDRRMIRVLVRLGAYINVPSPNGKTALAIAIENRQWVACAQLISHGALPMLPLHDGYPALHHILRNLNTDAQASDSLLKLIRYLRRSGIRFDTPVTNPDERRRKERPTVPLYELLVTNAQSRDKYRHLLLDPQVAAPPVPTVTMTTAAIPGNASNTATQATPPVPSTAEIHALLTAGDALAGFIAWLDADPRHLQWQDPQSGQGLLHLAAAGEHVEAVQLLLACGLDSERLDRMDLTPAQLLTPRQTTGLTEAAQRIAELLRR